MAALTAATLALLPLLTASIDSYWPDMPARSVLASQVAQESGWRVRATLKTSRELGAGLGQFTKTARFDAIHEMVTAHRELRGWSWANAYDPHYQLPAVVLKNRDNYRLLGWPKDPYNRMAMMDGAYNSGLGSILQRRRICAKTPGCDPSQWFGHLERSSGQSRVKQKGYGQSFADITNTHVRNVLIVRRPPFAAYYKEK